jgi:hypothetical protein
MTKFKQKPQTNFFPSILNKIHLFMLWHLSTIKIEHLYNYILHFENCVRKLRPELFH